MYKLWPPSEASAVIAPEDLDEIYGYPDLLDKPYVRLNYSATVNGKIAVNGRSDGLGSDIDKLVFGWMRRLADVILVTAGTMRADRYRGARTWEALRAQRRARGQREVAPIAVVTASADIDTSGPLFNDTSTPPIILTVTSASAKNVAKLERAGAHVLTIGSNPADAKDIIQALSGMNLNRILCEGGPSLFSNIIAAEVYDEVCVTLSPNFGGSREVSSDMPDILHPMQLRSVLSDGNVLLMQYGRG